jgi:hypothetical protein
VFTRVAMTGVGFRLSRPQPLPVTEQTSRPRVCGELNVMMVGSERIDDCFCSNVCNFAQGPVDCPQAGPGRPSAIFAGPGPGP